jgi:pseudaminic acid biosynthesis-associated methylase
MAKVAGRETLQQQQWASRFGLDYTDRNFMTPAQLDELWIRNHGISRTEMNRRFLHDIPKDARILEVGCNIGNQLLLLQNLGYTKLHGVDVQEHALEVARRRTKNIELTSASVFDLPYEDAHFDLVFTSGVLIHISPDDLPAALDEIHRCARTHVMGSEYYAPSLTEVNYREHKGVALEDGLCATVSDALSCA